MGEMHPTESQFLHVAGVAAEAPRVPGDGEDGIGARLEQSGKELLECGQALSQLVEPAGQTLIREAIANLGQQAFRVVVVGQIKSGKSSFINALVGQPFLLPTDVRPWTTSVTNLHFGQAPPDDYASAFHFFSEREWQELAEGGGPVRELTQRLDPGFDGQTLRRHVEALKQRASGRLGEEFAELLGGIHYFNDVDRDVLPHYVCSGESPAEVQGTALGKYADITKRADLYFDKGPFAFPATVTDTPGTNDPFLIRDEITRRCLNSADVFIVVLSARQPLSKSDLALLRLMQGLNKERIVAFVNRIDDFSDVSYDLAEVLMYVERKLKDEFPGASIPVIAGSAAWANCALMPGAEMLNLVLNRRSFGYLTELGLAQPDDGKPGALSDPLRRQRLCNGLLRASGLPAVYHALADRIGSSQAARSQLQVARCFREMAQASASSLRFELQSLMDGQLLQNRQQEEVAELIEKAAVLTEVAEKVERSGKTIEQQLLRILGEEMAALRNALWTAVNLHAANERYVLVETLRHGSVPRAWTHEGVELRRNLAGIFAMSFERAVTRIFAFQAKVAPELHRLMSFVAPDLSMPAQPDRSALEIPLPNVAALSRLVALDLDGAWWSGLWNRRESTETYGDQIEALIKSEFQAVVDELVQTAESALRGYTATTTRWSFGLCVNIVQGVKRFRDQMAAHLSAVENISHPTGQKAEAERRQQLEQLHDQLQKCEALHRRLDAIFEELDAGLPVQSSAVP
jgi:signal recognition particle receptor subunit beta